MPNLVLVRHGQSQWNLEDRFTGWVDVELTPEARRPRPKQAEALIGAAGLDLCQGLYVRP